MKTRLPVHHVYQPNTPRVLVRRLLVHHVYQQSMTNTPRVLVRAFLDPRLIHLVYTLKDITKYVVLFLAALLPCSKSSRW